MLYREAQAAMEQLRLGPPPNSGERRNFQVIKRMLQTPKPIHMNTN